MYNIGIHKYRYCQIIFFFQKTANSYKKCTLSTNNLNYMLRSQGVETSYC